MGTGRSEKGFTVIELMVVVLILGILIAISIPVYVSASSQASLRTCFQNQRTLEGGVNTWLTLGESRQLADLVGPVDSSNPVIVDHIVGVPPRCPSGATPSDPDNPTVAEGGYVFTATGDIQPCPNGRLGPHGHY